MLVPLFFVSVGEMDIKGLSIILGHFQVKTIVNLGEFYFRSFEVTGYKHCSLELLVQS